MQRAMAFGFSRSPLAGPIEQHIIVMHVVTYQVFDGLFHSLPCRGKRDHDAHVPASQFAEQAVFVSTAARPTRAMECTRPQQNNNKPDVSCPTKPAPPTRTRGASAHHGWSKIALVASSGSLTQVLPSSQSLQRRANKPPWCSLSYSRLSLSTLSPS